MATMTNTDLSPAERHLADCAAAGEHADLIAAFPRLRDRVIRPRVFRDLCLGRVKGHAVDPAGIHLRGAVFYDEVSLVDVDLAFGIEFDRCIFRSGIDLSRATLRYFGMYGCRVRVILRADRAAIAGNVGLTVSPGDKPIPFVARCPVDLRGARIGGQLNCMGGRFQARGGYCLWLERIEIGSSVILRDLEAMPFTAWGTVLLFGAHIQGGLLCRGGNYGPPFGDPTAGEILRLEAARVGGIFEWSPNSVVGGGDCSINLRHAQAAVLHVRDAAIANNDQRRRFALAGLTYSALGQDLASNPQRLANWIELADGGGCLPQPYEQMARVLRAEGNRDAADEIAIAKHVHWRNDYKGRWAPLRRFLEWVFLDVPVRYGHKPLHALVCAFIICVLASTTFWAADREGVMGPVGTDTVVLARSAPGAPPRLIRVVPPGHPRFQPVAYTLDVFVPVLDLDQQTKWAPNSSKPWGTECWVLVWVLTALGWYLSTLFISAFTGLIQTE